MIELINFGKTYGEYEEASQKFLRAMLSVWHHGDRDGHLFAFPKCDLHVTRAFQRVPAYAWDLLGLCTLVPLLWDASALTLVMFPFGVIVFYLA